MESILTSVKQMLGLTEEYTPFDMELTMHINSILPVLTQIGIGPVEGFNIVDASDTWEDFIGVDPRLNMVKTYIYIRVKLIFDSQAMSSATIEAYNQTARELEWRLNTAAEHQVDTEEG